MEDGTKIISPDYLIRAYSTGYFPMAEKTGEIYWHSPDPRAIFPLEKVKMPRSLRQSLRKNNFSFTVDACFDRVIKECANRTDTWISKEIIDSYIVLHRFKHAHSVETWKDGELAGGLYGVALGGAFFGESMFSFITNASKSAFYFLVYKLKESGYILLDSQYLNEFTESLGAVEIPKSLYLGILRNAIEMPLKF